MMMSVVENTQGNASFATSGCPNRVSVLRMFFFFFNIGVLVAASSTCVAVYKIDRGSATKRPSKKTLRIEIFS